MVKLTERQIGLIARALAEPRRFRLLRDVAAHGKPMACGSIVARHKVTHATISHHLHELEFAGLIAIERDGKFANIALRRDVWDAYLAHLAAI